MNKTFKKAIGIRRNIAEKRKAILIVRAKLLDAARFWLNKQGFVEIQGPTLIPAVSEQSNSFLVNFFDKKANLSSGLQPYSDVFVDELEKIYTIAPSFRAEYAQPKRKLSEFWRIEVVARPLDLKGVINLQAKFLEHICQTVSKSATDQLKKLGRSAGEISKVKAPFLILTYDDVVEQLQRIGQQIYWGQTLDIEMEQNLSSMFEKPFFICDFPVCDETFFHMDNPERPELSLSADLLAPDGYGEIASSGQMINNRKILLRKIREMKINPENKKWYLNLKRFSVLPQSGFAFGVERILKWLCGIEDIREITTFPRSYEQIYP